LPPYLTTPSPHHRHLHPFPTRRSSDLGVATAPFPGRGPDRPWPHTSTSHRHIGQAARLQPGRGVPMDAGDHRRAFAPEPRMVRRSEEHTSELQSLAYLVCRLLLEKKKK